jgi:hypothetical protein
MKRCLAIALLTLGAIVPPRAWAQTPPEPVLNVMIDPPRVVVGQRTTLRIDVLAPNYMTSPPELPDFQVRNAVTRQLQSVNLSEERNGTSYAGVRFEFAIYPQEPGSFAISDQKVKVRYAAEPPAVREQVLALPRVSFAAFIPDAAVALNPYLAAQGLTIEQSIRRSSEQLKVGDSVTRTVTVRAEETPAMLLPPITLTAPDGLAVYPAQPSLEDKTEGRTDALTASRTDSATYILQRAGGYELPAIDVRWWNAKEGRVETAHLDAVPMQVAVNPAAESGSATPDVRSNWMAMVDLVADHWIAAILSLAALAALCRLVPRAARAVAARHRKRHESYLRSERYSFDRLRRAARSGDAKASYFALLDWLQRFGPPATVDTLKAAAGDPILGREVAALETRLFAGQPASADWSPRSFIRHVSAARRNLRRSVVHRKADSALPQQLNPVNASSASAHWGRRPAR